ncbi:hypothetical protein LX15_004805 [Streptoalloteichus tenebrarius]|uniref:Uncharacterized protein n=1 Tax=Streptoalloteichus tenebrarius (strain ATCC 17920 / DSM 40477 / JCM 4838 / CBS 697.72 / NBRC 16177 / NCIMB 11028 / NRRL B-12390 / A12253. 1 / ISP 5477) TaxID=1933 RepID=A0ABT1HZZ3_STRSD|nr:hypothetical protein [Streptoalloteichus tenebrarius]MCP2261085.1 hypothetical protein [Streptoalloteichus tenebrarius]BFF03120.1 hypothetical protein GCM10020241_47950 [Streptoalloteichus tenebrarius]
MPNIKINARDVVVQVEAATANTWVLIDGLTSATVNPSENEETAETTTFSSAGHYEQMIMQRGASMELEGVRLVDQATGASEPGQARCEELATKVGHESLGRVRFRHPLQTTWKVWTATFSVGEQGGGTNDMMSWSCTITRSGASTTMAVTP